MSRSFLRSVPRTTATLFLIVFADGTETEEYGQDEEDVRAFCALHYKGSVIDYITPR